MRYNSGKKKFQFIRGSVIKVRVEDLMTSRVIVRVQCDKCNGQKEVIYQGYLNCLHEDGKYYCNKCASQLFNGGDHSYRWKPELSEEQRNANNSRIGNVKGYYEFIRIVQQRDSYKCVLCGSNEEIHVHHLNGFSWDKKNKTNPENAVCLCKRCHDTFHRIYGKENNTKEQFDEFSNHKEIDLSYSSDLSSLKKVILLNTGKIYDTLKQCAKELGIDHRRVYDVCHHKKYSVNQYHFMYLDEYEKTPPDELKKAYTYQGSNQHGDGVKKGVICVTTGEEFECISDACMKYLGNRKNDGRIAMCCNGKRKSVGKLSNREKLVWKWRT